MDTPSAAAAANIFSAAAAVVRFSRAASPETARETRGCTRFRGVKFAGFSGRRLLTTTHGLAGSVSEYCLDRRDAADGGAAAPVAGAVADGGADGFGAADGGADAERVPGGADDAAGLVEGAAGAAEVGVAVPRGTPGEP